MFIVNNGLSTVMQSLVPLRLGLASSGNLTKAELEIHVTGGSTTYLGATLTRNRVISVEVNFSLCMCWPYAWYQMCATSNHLSTQSLAVVQHNS